ncbi:hypothetical protein EDB86DRAFT_2395978 [Lactarius hatsudake]|nr:hypothetical protein EDB86DRAFT_2395978 [Lactarius hatsudake]
MRKDAQANMGCGELIETTAAALNDNIVASMLLVVQRDQLKLSVQTALYRLTLNSNVSWIVDSPGSIINLWRRGNTGIESGLLCSYATWSNRKVSTNPPPTMRSVLFLPSRLRSNTSPPHVNVILAPTRTQELMKVYNLLIQHNTWFTKTPALVSSSGSPSSPPSLASFRLMTSPRGLNPDHPR